MAGKSKCCLIEGCPSLPELELEGLTQYGAWIELSECCWRVAYRYDETPADQRYTGGIYYRKDYEYKGRVTHKGAIGSRNSAGECVYTTQQDVGYRERWQYDYDSWRKFAVYGVMTEVIVHAQRIEVIEAGLPVRYWHYRIQQGYIGYRGWERKRRTFSDNIAVSNLACADYRSGNLSIRSTYLTQPGSAFWVEESFITFEAGSTTCFKIKEQDLEELDPGEWLEREVSSEDANISPSSVCVPGTQLPAIISYSISAPFPCESLSVNTDQYAIACNNRIIKGEAEVWLTGQQLGYGSINFFVGLYLFDPCCIDLESTCSWGMGGSPGFVIFWYWDHEMRIDINNCETEYNPYDMILHGVFNIRVRFPI